MHLVPGGCTWSRGVPGPWGWGVPGPGGVPGPRGVYLVRVYLVLGGVPGPSRGVGTHVSCSNASWVMVTCGPAPVDVMTFADGNKLW